MKETDNDDTDTSFSDLPQFDIHVNAIQAILCFIDFHSHRRIETLKFHVNTGNLPSFTFLFAYIRIDTLKLHMN